MTFRPDRDKLNAHFEGYRLGKKSLACISQSFAEEVRVARLQGDDFGYQHVRAFTLRNHLTIDPWAGDSVYWIASSGAILRGRYLGSAGVQVSTVFQCPEGVGTASPSINPSLLFITAHHCLLTIGSSSNLLLLYTPSRAAPAASGDGASGNEDNWKLVEELKSPEAREEGVSILAANYSETDHQLRMATMALQHSVATPSVKGKEEESVSKPPIASYNWYCCDIDLHSSATRPSGSKGKSAGGEESLVTNIDLVCSLQSSTVALYGAFAGDQLIILSEAEVVLPPSQPGPLGEAQRTEEKTKTENTDSEQLIQGAQVTKEENEAERFVGLGFEGEGEKREGKKSSEEPQYQWSQTEGDVTITVPLPEDVTKSDVHCVIDRRELVVGLSDGTTFLRGRLFAPISPECSTWTIGNHSLEVSLEKESEGQWTSLTAEEGGDEGRGLPLRGPVADQLSSEELEELKRKVAEATREGRSAESSSELSSLVQGMFYEECDINEEDATFFIFRPANQNPQRVPLAGRQFLFSPLSLPQTPPLVCLRHDVDAVLWQPQAPPTTDDSDKPCIGWKHVGTFNALAYVQAARRDKKFTVCPPSMKFAALCDCSRLVFVYLQPEEGVKGNSAAQYVTTLRSQEHILGLGATDSGLVFVLKEHELHVIVVYR